MDLTRKGQLLSGGWPYAGVRVIDNATGRGVPCVGLTSTSSVTWFTDSAGIAAVDANGVAASGAQLWLDISSDGYVAAADGFGYRGVRANVSAGAVTNITVTRANIAQRMYRLTGEGIYRDTVLMGKSFPPPPIAKPLLNAQVMGQDSVLSTVYQNKIFWFWGDTLQPSYPLGNFYTTAATSKLPPSMGGHGLHENVGVDLEYFVDPQTGFVRGVAPNDRGSGPVWISDVFVVSQHRNLSFSTVDRNRVSLDAPPLSNEQNETMFALFAQGGFSTNRRGLLRWNDSTSLFDEVAHWPVDSPMAPFLPSGHAFLAEGTRSTCHRALRRSKTSGAVPLSDALASSLEFDSAATPSDTVQFVYFGNPWPKVRIPIDADFTNEASYESFTPLKQGTLFNGPASDLDTNATTGRPQYSWKCNTPPLTAEQETALVTAGMLHDSELPVRLRDGTTSACQRIWLEGGSMFFNADRGKYIVVATQQAAPVANGMDHGQSQSVCEAPSVLPSTLENPNGCGGATAPRPPPPATPLGEVWFAESPTLEGPWEFAVKIISHNTTGMSFYNPTQIFVPRVAGEGRPRSNRVNGGEIFIAGTLAHTFTHNATPIPRSDMLRRD
eukprot:INCI1105.5.p1 GENE.INCI1105.5~~INCI1105.5.p1  ORF type:complete len:610 (+),score=69.94 INCI1105.5:312-2141(+)